MTGETVSSLGIREHAKCRAEFGGVKIGEPLVERAGEQRFIEASFKRFFHESRVWS